ncbi:(2,3-dihydroxybenzoyl)adenylate synthase [Actinophytocola oryzae]|uniref:2,3-dihydroxybenzoate-AMP ligase n=1 Tax=Actinophytocola oryzae TaxID=502181 RepID=A0A4R7W0J4_9PSEU|nr:AMP-binding protein [Actinophytocola oryzae]TDV56030.1 2,3-dihydroxybenzoate-AMP ligase [Actinophytocola oryzae]
MLEGSTPWPAEVARRYRTAGLWRGETLGALLRTVAAEHGESTALVHGDRRISYLELDGRADRMAAGFTRYGITSGDRVVVQLPNVPEFVAVCFALFRLGAIPVFALTAHRSQEIGHLCRITGAVAYVLPGVHRGFDHRVLARQVRSGAPTLRVLFSLSGQGGDVIDLSAVDAEPREFAEPDPSDAAFFLLSGGTTALPKVIPRTHDDYTCQVRAASSVLGMSTSDVYLAVLPLEFNFTWGCPGVIGTLVSGGTVVLADAPTADDCFAMIVREQVTVTSLVPSIAQLWLEAAEWSDADLSSLRVVQIGGAKLQRSVAERITPVLGCELQQVFGMAEGLLTLTRLGDPTDVVLGTQGRPLSEEDEIRIVGPDDRDVAAGEVGELLTRGPYTLRGYYRATEHNAIAFTEDGYYRSGDLVRLTADGDLVVEGRIKDVVIRGGDKISAAEVEGHLLGYPGVLRAAVIGVPDDFLGERTCAYLVVTGEHPSLHDLKGALRDRGLADYKLPDRVEFVDELPVTPLGKVDKKALVLLADQGRPTVAKQKG